MSEQLNQMKHRLIVNGKKTNIILDKPIYNKKVVQRFVPNETLEHGSIWYEYLPKEEIVTIL